MSDSTLHHDLVFHFGDDTDGVIGIPALTHDGQVVEASYFFGRDRPKNIIVISSQVGCPMGCSFCELGAERFVRNLTAGEIADQVRLVIAQASLRGIDVRTTPHKITVANGGEPLLNPHLVDGLELVREIPASFKVSTIYPDSAVTLRNLERLADFSAEGPPVQLQVSLISTTEIERQMMGSRHVARFADIRRGADLWRARHGGGRKVNLSLLVTAETTCRADYVTDVFPPDLFRFRFREYVPNRHGRSRSLESAGPERLSAIKDDFRQHGYEVYDWASPSPVEWRFRLSGNVIRRMYLDLIR